MLFCVWREVCFPFSFLIKLQIWRCGHRVHTRLCQKAGDEALDAWAGPMSSANLTGTSVHGSIVCGDLFSCYCRIICFHTGVRFLLLWLSFPPLFLKKWHAFANKVSRGMSVSIKIAASVGKDGEGRGRALLWPCSESDRKPLSSGPYYPAWGFWATWGHLRACQRCRILGPTSAC